MEKHVGEEIAEAMAVAVDGPTPLRHPSTVPPKPSTTYTGQPRKKTSTAKPGPNPTVKEHTAGPQSGPTTYEQKQYLSSAK